ncbi:MAG: D-2-hydroxyacid dehydrogenase [Chloroflexi bacterium]|nr:D-2-hydroxyacid dehydrogenase [Chloroflexota bacterium]
MKMVVLDGQTLNPGDISWAEVEALGDLKVYARTPYEEAEILKRIGDAEVVMTNKTPISKATIEKAPNLKFVSVLATGFNVVDIESAKQHGVVVSNVPTYGTNSTAQFAIGLLLEVCHHIGEHNRAVHEGRWETSEDYCFWDYPLIELDGKTMGIIGFGRIGQTVGRIAKAFGMTVIANSRSISDETKEIAEAVSLDELFARADVISLHCPLTPETQNLINKDTIAKMKDGVILINNSRGPVLNEQDVADALNSGKISYAAVDVVSVEPILPDNPLLKAKNCIITPHISWAPIESRKRLMHTTAENIEAYQKGKPQNVVNP